MILRALAKPEVSVEYLRQSIRYAAECGAPMIMVDDGPTPAWTSEEENYTLMRYTLQEAALVTMKISSVKGEPAAKLQRNGKVPRWIVRREYRSTYRNHLEDSEETAAGLRVVLRTGSRDRVRRRAARRNVIGRVGIVAITEPAGQTADFVVTHALRISRYLHHQIRSNVVGIVGGVVVEATIGSQVADKVVHIAIGVGQANRLRILE